MNDATETKKWEPQPGKFFAFFGLGGIFRGTAKDLDGNLLQFMARAGQQPNGEPSNQIYHGSLIGEDGTVKEFTVTRNHPNEKAPCQGEIELPSGKRARLAIWSGKKWHTPTLSGNIEPARPERTPAPEPKDDEIPF